MDDALEPLLPLCHSIYRHLPLDVLLPHSVTHLQGLSDLAMILDLPPLEHREL